MDTKKIFKGKKQIQYGVTHAELRKNILLICHTGNMGSSIQKDVNPNLKHLGFPTINILKKKFEVIDENGAPDYMYTLKLKI